MKNKLGIILGMCALMLGLAGAASAQVVKHRTRDGRIVYQTTTRPRTRDYRYDRRDDWRNNRRYDRRDNDRDDYNRQNNGRYNDNYRRNNSRYGQYGNQPYYGARTYRLPNGRIVTILPDGRRIYR